MGKLTPYRRLSASISRFLRKRQRRNWPLEAFRETESFKQFERVIRRGIKKQAQWTAKNINDIADKYKNDQLTDSQLEAYVGQWLLGNMPMITSYVSPLRVSQYLTNAFIEAVKNQYRLAGVIAKGADFSINFALTNEYYIALLKNAANVLLKKAMMDETTRKQIAKIIKDNRLDQKTIDEVANIIEEQFDNISIVRAFMIANTESNAAMSMGQMAFMRENGVPTKAWIGAGPSTCPICQANEDDGFIPTDENFSSGDSEPPAHPNCECYLEAGEIDLESISLWTGD